MFGAFILYNRTLAGRLMKRLPHAHDVLDEYGAIVGEQMQETAAVRVVDVGGGRHCAFQQYKLAHTRICAVDISGEELDHNQLVTEKYVSDATSRIPLESGTADIVASRAVVEHMRGVDRYVREAHRVLKTGGALITAFPNKWSPGALLNRCIPRALTRTLLFRLIPDSRAKCGFPAYYEHCSIAQFTTLLRRSGFKVTGVRKGYFQADYLAFFFPFFAVAVLYDYLCWVLDLTYLCSAVIICAQKVE